MTRFVQILVFGITVQCLVESKPLFKGFSYKKSFDVDLKPINFKPISFVKEKWSPFGRYGKKHSIVKRSPDEIDALTNVIGKEEKKDDKKDDLSRLPAEVAEVYEVVEPIDVEIVPIITPPKPEPPSTPAPPPPPPPPSPQTILFTDISRPVNDVVPPLQPTIIELTPITSNSIVEEKPKAEVPPPPPPANPEAPSAFIKGTRLAMYFGNIFLELFSQFLANARTTLAQTPAVI